MSRSTKIAFHNRDKYIALGLNIAYYRKRQGMTQEQLAEKAGISEGQFCQKLAGNYVFRQDEIDRICALLSIQPTDIGQYFFLPKKL